MNIKSSNNGELAQYQEIYERACLRKGGESALLSLISKPEKDKKLKKLGDDRFLAEFTKKVFQSGFVWRVVDNKWDNFERLFYQFGIQDVLMMPEDLVEEIAADPAIIRNYRKVLSIKENAFMIHEVREQGKTFASFVADWPSDDIVGLWAYLKKNGSRLGGNTGPYALRSLGKDTFIISRDVEKCLREADVFSGGVGSKRSQAQIQLFFNEMREESGWTLKQLSQLVAYSVGDNFILAE